MRGAFGKALCKSARVGIGQILISVRCSIDHINFSKEALRRSKFKFPGRQKIFVSRKFGFTNIVKSDYYKLKEDGKIMPDGVGAKIIKDHGPVILSPNFLQTFRIKLKIALHVAFFEFRDRGIKYN